MLNVVALMGRLVADPELRHTPNGVATCTFRIAVDRSFVRAGEERKADFIDIVVWRQTAEFVCKYFHKGNLIAVDGSIQTRTYEDKTGNKRYAFEVVALSLIHISEPTRQAEISYAVFCLKKKNKKKQHTLTVYLFKTSPSQINEAKKRRPTTT